MVKWIVIVVAVYILYRLFANDVFKKREKEEKVDKKKMERKIAAGEMAQDPVCGAYVSVDESIKVRDGKKVHYFCSYDCRQKFLDSLNGETSELKSGKEE